MYLAFEALDNGYKMRDVSSKCGIPREDKIKKVGALGSFYHGKGGKTSAIFGGNGESILFPKHNLVEVKNCRNYSN